MAYEKISVSLLVMEVKAKLYCVCSLSSEALLTASAAEWLLLCVYRIGQKRHSRI